MQDDRPDYTILSHFETVYRPGERALAAQADLIVSGDQDLLVLQVFEGIPILTAAQAMEWLRNAAS